jgi:hypothetical protein
MKNRYRIINEAKGSSSWYWIEIKRWWLPFWYKCIGLGPSTTQGEAKARLRELTAPTVRMVVYEEDE